MSFAVDVNLLLYASTTASPHHDEAGAFLKRCHAGPDLVYLGWPTVMSYLRMVTHSGIVSPPLTPAQAMGNIDSLLGLPHVRVLSEQPGFWDLYREVTGSLVVRSKLVPDAHLAALLRQHGVRTLYTNDADFLKFPFLDVRNPFE